MKKLTITFFSILTILLLAVFVFASEERLILSAKIDGKDVRFALDTGAPDSLTISKQTAKRLFLNTWKEGGNTIATFELEIAGDKWDKVQALVIDFLPFSDIDGFIGWPALRGNMWQVQWQDMSLLSIQSMPEEALSWQVLKLHSQAPIAAAFIHDDKQGLIYFDTGSKDGIALSESRWHKLVIEKPYLPMTLKTGFMPAAGGFFVTELCWSDKFKIDSLIFDYVMIEKSAYKWPQLEAVFGLEALKHFEIVFDLKENNIYMKKRPYPRVNLKYNRLGASFPPASLASDKLVGHVLENSPAHRAGLRTGDVLLRVGNIDMTQWRIDPSILKKEFWTADAGTEYKLEIERNGKKQVFTVVLEEIFKITDDKEQLLKNK